MLDAFRRVDEVLLNAVQGISDLIVIHGFINVDFADVRTVMNEMGRALMGTGYAAGDRKALEAAQQAIASPLLEDANIDGATGILINITGGPDLTLSEIHEAASLIQEAAHEEANIIFGSVVDANMEDQVRITVIATGFDRAEQAARPTVVTTARPQPERQGYQYQAPQTQRAPAQRRPEPAPRAEREPSTESFASPAYASATVTAPEHAYPGSRQSDHASASPSEQHKQQVAQVQVTPEVVEEAVYAQPPRAEAQPQAQAQPPRAEAQPQPKVRNQQAQQPVQQEQRTTQRTAFSVTGDRPDASEPRPRRPRSASHPVVPRIHPGLGTPEEQEMDIPAFIRKHQSTTTD
jgi:cell division protein FtsZ